MSLIIDAHAHATPPNDLLAFNYRLTMSPPRYRGRARPQVSDDSIAATLQDHIRDVDAVGTDVQLISPRPWAFPTSIADQAAVETMCTASNDVIARTVKLFPARFRGVAGLPQCAGVSPANCVDELERCVKELGFVGCKINPDVGEGDGRTPPMGDEWWYPLYEKMVELDVPGLIHTGGRRNAREPEAGHFPNEETVAANAVLDSRVLRDFPPLKLIVAHGGGYLPYQVGRQRAPRFNAMQRNPEVEPYDASLRRLWYDTVLLNQESLELLFRVIGPDRCLFGSDKPSGSSAIDPATGKPLDDIKPYIEAIPWLTEDDRQAIFEGNARKVFSRLAASLR
ncbi:MAG: amidohydrolase [Chloroflexi bacterium]|nr:amidohydrolase [Chloroflexota bacterium]